MGFWTLFEVASLPMIQVLLISFLGALMATEYLNLLPKDARRSLNKLVFMVFTPSLMFASLAKTVTLEDIISWWFMPVNIGFTFLIGGILGWILVKILRPKPYLEGLVIATCSSGNLGNLLLIIVPAICNEDGSPFGDSSICSSVGLSYASFSMALGGFFIWTYTFHLIRGSAAKLKALQAVVEVSKAPNNDLDASQETHLLNGQHQENVAIVVASSKSAEDTESHAIVSLESEHGKGNVSSWTKLTGFLHQILEELLEPPTVAAILGFLFGATTFLRNLIIGSEAPLRVIQDSIKLLGDGTIPCITLILGGNLTEGLRASKIKSWIVVGVICVRYIILPAIGLWVVKAAGHLGFLPSDPLFHYVLMIQYTLPPAMNIGTMTQLFDVGQEECSVLFLWTYLVAALALTAWSTIFMWILS
ncbi:protein PIN-LIKES 7-like isoform X2 [Populus alba x Populus x berolinensis]|nr:protein PIN-LIKES 7-like isoform X2 [Populus alba x Populus x berolinensis]